MSLNGTAATQAEPPTALPQGPRPGRVVAVNRFYWPDHAATSQILTDLATFLAARGWDISVVTSRLRYDNGAEQLAAREVKDGVTIRRVRTSRRGRAGLAGRALDYLTFYASAGAALLREVRRGDVLLVTTDPPLLAVLAAPIARRKRAHLVTWNHDVFPEVAGALGLSWANGPLGRLLVWLRNRALRGTALNVALSDVMADRLVSSGTDAGTLRVVANWSDTHIHPLPGEENSLRREWGLQDSFVIGYSGNLGRAHMPEKVAELVRRTRDLPGLSWLFIGGGAGMERIRALAGEPGAENIHVRPYQRRENLSLSLSVPDIHLVALDPGCEGLIVPSKISGILAAGRPVIYLGDSQSALAREIADRGIGVSLDAGSPESWRETIAGLRAQPEELDRMGRRARACSEAEPPRAMLLRWESVLAEAAGAPRTEVA